MQISVVTPSFRQLDWLRVSIASVADQIEKDSSTFSVQHLVQDGGSPEFAEFAETCKQAPPRTGYQLALTSEKDAGMYDALNRGFSQARGDVVSWLNCDEQYLPGTLPFVADFFLNNPDVDILFGDALLLDSACNPISYRRIMIPARLHTRLDHLHTLSCAMFMRRKCLPSPVFDPRWKIIGDAVLVESFISRGYSLRACRRPLAAYAFTGQNLSAMKAQATEHLEWVQRSTFSSTVLTTTTKLLHRLRRMAHGAYRAFDIKTNIYTRESTSHRIEISRKVPGTWPRSAAVNG